MKKSYINAYIDTIKKDPRKLVDLKKAIFRYKLLGKQYGEKFLNEAIAEVKKEKDKKSMNDIEVFIAYENEIGHIVQSKHLNYSIRPIKEIESKDIEGLVKRYNITPEVAQTIIDLKIDDPYNSSSIARTILKYNLKGNPNAIELSRIILQKELYFHSNPVILAEIILKYNLKDNPDAIEIADFIVNNNLKDNSDALNIYNFIMNNNLNNNSDAVAIANMVCKLGISLDLAMEVSQYNHENYKFKQSDEKYIFHKLRQLYRIKMQIESNFNMEKEIERIMRTISIDSLKAKYLLISCLGNNWGRNSSFYSDYNRYKNDFNNNQQYTDEEISAIRSYTHRPTINRFARGFEIRGGTTYYNNGAFTDALTNQEIIDETKNNYMPLYNALNKYALSKDVIVFRGAGINSLQQYKINMNDSEEEAKKKFAGKYEDGGFMSTSVVIEKKGSFLENEVNFIIDLKSGTPCGDLSGYTEYDVECEILLPPNVTFNVNDVKKIDGKFFVYLTSIPTKSLSYDMKSEGKSR